MGLAHSLVGVESEPIERSWGATDALAVGAEDPTAELEFTTENTAGVPPTESSSSTEAASGSADRALTGR